MAIFNVLDYGATADDATDDSAAIQAAIDAAYAAGGGTVYVPEGTFIISGDHTNPSAGCVEVRSNVTFTGAGMGVTVLKLADNFNDRINGIVRTPVTESASNVVISNLTIDGNRANNVGHQAGVITGVKENSSGKIHQDITITGIEVKNCTSYGIDPHEITYNLIVENSVAHGNGTDGFVADFIVDGIFRNNIAYNNDRHGFNVTTSSTDILLENNISYDNGSAGVVVQRGSIFPDGQNDIDWPARITITGGEYYGNAREGVLLQLADQVTITGTSIHDNLFHGIRVEGATDTVITGNTIYNNSQGGDGVYDEISIRQRVDATVDPPRIYMSEDTLIHDNVIYDDGAIRARYGIREELTNSTAADPSGTIVYENDVTGMRSGDYYIPPHSATQGDDVFYGTSSGDTMAGLGGNDTYIVNHSLDVVVEGANAGIDKVIASLNHTLSANVENLELIDTAIRGTGNALNNIIIGNAQANELEGLEGNDTLDGAAGADVMQGGDGNDTYYVDNAGDVLVEKDHEGAGGFDTVFSTVSYVLSAEVEKLVLQGTAHLNATGNAGANTLIGNAGNNRLDGMGGPDIMEGGKGNDTYVVDHTGDVIIEVANGGLDTVESSISYTLSANLNNLTLTGTADRDGNGNAIENVIIGNAGANRLHGMGANDVIEGGLGADQLYGDAGNDVFVLRKGEFAGDVIEDFAGKGTAVGDSLRIVGFSNQAFLIDFGGGNYMVKDGSYEESFRIKTPVGELAFDASDFKFLGGSPAQAILDKAPVAATTGNSKAGTEDVTLTGTLPAGFDADGDPLSYIAVSALSGLTVNANGSFTFVPPADKSGDFQFQYVVADSKGAQSAAQTFTISLAPANDAPVAAATGNAATGKTNSTIAGLLPAGSDVEGDTLTYVQVGQLSGFSLANDGSFTYKASATPGDVTFSYKVVDKLGAESATQSFTITVEQSLGLKVNGTTGADTLDGAAGNDVIDGLAGSDIMRGHAGDDLYYVDSSQDQVIELAGEGNDKVYTTASFTLAAGMEIETLEATGASAVTLKGNELANRLMGNTAANTINGDAGADVIDGGLGADLLTGGTGLDTFVFSTALSAGNVDTIADFNVADDTIALKASIFSALGVGTLSAADFVIGTAALDAEDHIIYDSTAGKLLYDADGAGGADAVAFALIGKNLAMTNLDFVVVNDLFA